MVAKWKTEKINRNKQKTVKSKYEFHQPVFQF
jgi:hypothetical protein